MDHKSRHVSLLGLQISILGSYKESYKKLLSLITDSSPKYVTVNNVHTLIEGIRNEKYGKIINESSLSLPDGKPLSVYAKLKGTKDISRIFGPTFFEKTLDWGQEDGVKHFLFGSSEEISAVIIKNIKQKYPGAIIAGAFSPPYKKVFSEKENDEFLSIMKESGADVFWIGLGAPKQEIWMYENYKKLNKGIMIGIGAGFDYLAGKTKHAPEWMKNASLEWLYRLIQEPGRLWKRYLVSNSLFLWYVCLELVHLKRFNK